MKWHKKPSVQIFNTITRKWDLYEFETQAEALAVYRDFHVQGCKVAFFYGSVAYQEPQCTSQEHTFTSNGADYLRVDADRWTGDNVAPRNE